MIESEIKIKLSLKEVEKTISILKKLKAKIEFCAKQITYRFDTKDKKLENQKIFLRTRTGEVNTLTLKRRSKNFTKNIKSREELEIDLGKQKNISVLNKILSILGYKHKTIMEKYRYQWDLDNCKIAIDELPFGFFIEIEGNPKVLFLLKDKIGLKKLPSLTETYWDLFNKHNKDKKIVDIKFPKYYKSILENIFKSSEIK
jgi:adenylate cyclase, class 2